MTEREAFEKWAKLGLVQFVGQRAPDDSYSYFEEDQAWLAWQARAAQASAADEGREHRPTCDYTGAVCGHPDQMCRCSTCQEWGKRQLKRDTTPPQQVAADPICVCGHVKSKHGSTPFGSFCYGGCLIIKNAWEHVFKPAAAPEVAVPAEPKP